MKPATLFAILLMTFLSSLLLMTEAKAQEGNAFIEVGYQSALSEEQQSNFIRDVLTVTNIHNTVLHLVVKVDVPQGFSLVSTADIILSLIPGQSAKVPVTFSKSKIAPSGSLPGGYNINLQNLSTTLHFPFKIENREVVELRVLPSQRSFQVTEENRTVSIGMRIKNIGNGTYNFSVKLNNDLFNIHKKINLSLQPFKDTTFQYSYEIPTSLFKYFTNEKIVVTVGTDTNYNSYSYTISKIKNSSKQHESAYNLVPFSVETGAFLFGKELSYFWGANAEMNLNQNTSLSLTYRSKTFGIAGVQNDYFYAFLKHKRLNIAAGQLSDSRHFITLGLGAEVLYAKSDSQNVSVKVISNLQAINEQFNAQHLSVTANSVIAGAKLNSLAIVHKDLTRHTLGYIFENRCLLVNRDWLKIGLLGGVGYEQFHKSEDATAGMAGYSYGYNIVAEKPRWSLLSSASINTNSFPGIYRGWRSINNQLSYDVSNRWTVSPFFNKNYTRQDFFLDSMYHYNQLIYNLSSYGLRNYINFKWLSISGGYGREWSSGAITAFALPAYHTFLFGFDMLIKRKVRASFSSSYNVMPVSEMNAEPIAFYSFNGTVMSKHFGINTYYYQRPILNGDGGDDIGLKGFRKSFTVAPFVSFSMLRKKLNVRLQYGYYSMTSLLRNNNTQVINSNISYVHSAAGLDISLMGNYYMKSTVNIPNSITLSLRKTFNVPVIFKRKYHDVDVLLYEDLNGNLLFDNQDKLLDNLNFQIEGKSFKSDANGSVRYRNVDTGNYAIDFRNMDFYRGIIPVQGFAQHVRVDGALKVMVPFNKGKEISGTVSLILDSLSTTSFDVFQLKVTAVDSMGNVFTTFTDSKGMFRLSLPAGQYIVSLNPDAFDDNFRPNAMAYQVDLLHNETQNLAFVVKQKARKVNRVKAKM